MIHATRPEQKLAAVRHLTNCLSTYPMHEKEKGNDTIKQILHNKYDTAI